MMSLPRRAWCALFALGLACAGAAHADDPAAASGGVVLRVLPNGAGVGSFFKVWPDVRVERTDGAAVETRLKSTLDASARSAFYSGWLQPGQYRLVSVPGYGCHWGQSCGNGQIEIGAQFSRFEVKAGQLTDLGALVVTPKQFETHRIMLAHDDEPDHAATPDLVRELAPTMAPLLDRPMLGWDASTVPRGMARAGASAREGSFGFMAPVEADGHVLYGTADGVLVDWTPGGSHAMHDIGERVSVESVLAGPGNAWVAGGEFGAVRVSNDQGATWRSIHGDLPMGLVADLHQWHGQVIATVLHGISVDLLALDTAAPGAPHWTLLAHYKLDEHHYWDTATVRPETSLAGDKLVTLLPPRQVAVLDLASQEGAVRTLPDKAVWLDVGPDARLRLRTPGGFFGSGAYESVDLGKTWSSSSALARLERPAFRDATHGVSFATGSGPADGNPPDRRFYFTEDGRTWKEGEHTNIVFTRFFFGSDGTPYGYTVDNVVWRSLDGGKTWNKVA